MQVTKQFLRNKTDLISSTYILQQSNELTTQAYKYDVVDMCSLPVYLSVEWAEQTGCDGLSLCNFVYRLLAVKLGNQQKPVAAHDGQ